MDLQFEWDEAKSTANVRKHGVRFEEAITIFGDISCRKATPAERRQYERRVI